MKDDEFKKEYDKLKPRYVLISNVIKARREFKSYARRISLSHEYLKGCMVRSVSLGLQKAGYLMVYLAKNMKKRMNNVVKFFLNLS